MDTYHLDEEVPVETWETVRVQFEEAQDKLVKEYRLDRRYFIQELRKKLLEGEIFDDPDVERWQFLYAAMLDWAREARATEEADPPEDPVEAALGGIGEGDLGKIGQGRGGHAAQRGPADQLALVRVQGRADVGVVEVDAIGARVLPRLLRRGHHVMDEHRPHHVRVLRAHQVPAQGVALAAVPQEHEVVLRVQGAVVDEVAVLLGGDERRWRQ